MKKEILLIYGSGGHNEDARRLLESLKPYLYDYEFISLCDDDVRYILTEKYYKMPTVTDKFSYLKVLFNIPKSLVSAIRLFSKMRREHYFQYAISTGPGITMIMAPILRYYKIPIIYIENASRFYSRSLAGRFVYYFAKYFFVQNKELLNLYPKAIYKGRL